MPDNVRNRYLDYLRRMNLGQAADSEGLVNDFNFVGMALEAAPSKGDIAFAAINPKKMIKGNATKEYIRRAMAKLINKYKHLLK